MNKEQSAAITTAGALLALFVTGWHAVLGAGLAALMLLGGALYLIWQRRAMSAARRRQIITAVLLAALFAGAVVLALRFLSGEDGWICAHGQWVQHGHPRAPAPVTPCRN